VLNARAGPCDCEVEDDYPLHGVTVHHDGKWPPVSKLSAARALDYLPRCGSMLGQTFTGFS